MDVLAAHRLVHALSVGYGIFPDTAVLGRRRRRPKDAAIIIEGFS
jgi:hypothetical protein